MIYDRFGREIKEPAAARQSFGQRVFIEPSDRSDYDISRGLTPAKVDQIMIAANGGEPADLCRLCLELEEKNWDIFHALQTRHDAVMGIDWQVTPGGDQPADKKAAEAFDAVLKSAGGLNGLDSFNSLLSDLMSALLPGFAVSEIVWRKGGGVSGFSFVGQQFFTFRDGPAPRLITRDNPGGIELEPYKFIVHKHRRRGGDVTRGGLIRPLAWLHCFANLNVKDLLSFVERYGMPFLVAKVDNETWQNERSVLKQLIRNFGPSGGGVFTHSTEFELLQAANNTGDVYFKLLEYVGQAITKVVLGQTATAGDGGGWSNDGAQAQVRQDILESDCDALADTVTMQLAAPWTMFTQPPGTAAPQVEMLSAPPEDTVKKYEALKARYDTMGVAVRGGGLTPSEDLEEAIREELELPKMPPEVKAFWAKNKGVRAPITLKDAPQPPSPPVPGSKDSIAMAAEPAGPADAAEKMISELTENTLRGLLSDGEALAGFYRPLTAAVREAFAGLNPDDPELEKKFIAAADGFFAKYPALYEQIDTRRIEKAVSGAMLAARVNGYDGTAGPAKKI